MIEFSIPAVPPSLNGNRSHPLLLRLVKEMGAEANGPHADLMIVDVPDGVEWEIDQYDGAETIHEAHRSWP
jgi:hypothetical protein